MKRSLASTSSSRAKKRRQQPLSCTFTTNPSPTVVEQVVPASIPVVTPSFHPLQHECTPSPAASPNETILNNLEEDHHDREQQDEEQQDEEHDDEENHERDASIPIASDEDSLAGNIQHQKILIGIDMSTKDFDPRKPVFAKMKEIVHGHFDGPWTSIRKVPANTKTLWFEEFEKCFCWTVSTAAMKKVFLFQAGRSITNTFKPYFKEGTTPYFVKEDIWQRMVTLKRTDPNMLKQSKANIQNRSSKRSVESGPFRGGTRKVKKWIQLMEKEKGSRPKISEVVRILWSKDKKGDEIAPQTASYVAEFDKLYDEIPSSEPITKAKEMELWLKATNGVHNNRIFGFGEDGAGLVRSGMIDNLNEVPCSSTSYTQHYIEPFKEEMREEMKNLKEQNEKLKDMLERLLQHVQGGSAPPS